MTTDRYHRLVESLVTAGRPFARTIETATAVQVERGTVLAGGPVRPMPAVAPVVVDAAGHRRPVYRPLLVYAHAVVGADGLDPWLASLSADGDVSFTAANGAAAAAAVWSALAIAVARPAAADHRLFRRLVDGQRRNGALLPATASDNPEVHWYHELVVLHAAADFALATGDAAVWAAVERATHFHLNETEPDHATGQPWGLPAFVRVAGAEPLADAALHAVAAHQPGGAGGVALLLLADTLYGLRRAPGPAASETESR